MLPVEGGQTAGGGPFAAFAGVTPPTPRRVAVAVCSGMDCSGMTAPQGAVEWAAGSAAGRWDGTGSVVPAACGRPGAAAAAGRAERPQKGLQNHRTARRPSVDRQDQQAVATGHGPVLPLCAVLITALCRGRAGRWRGA